MKRFTLWALLTLLSLGLWTLGNVAATTQGWSRTPIAASGDPQAFMAAATKRIQAAYKGNLSMLLIERGEVFDEFNTSMGRAVNRDTRFGISSLSKWVTAVGVMTLVDAGNIDLDEPVSTYLNRWQLPASEFDNAGVTVRRLLSHTAGLTDGLGHDGFESPGDVQPLVEHLTQAQDADEGARGRVIVGLPPGSQWQYSGGGYNLLQLIVEEVSGQPFAEYMNHAVFTPLGMSRTDYVVREQDTDGNVAEYFAADGNTKAYPYYTSLAATGLHTTTSDMYRFVASQRDSDEASARILLPQTQQLMRQTHASMFGLAIWGAGPMLFADNNAGGFIIGHGGQSPSLNTTARLNPDTGNGIVIFETGNASLASDIATQWTLWETGKPDIYILRNALPVMFKRILIGYVIILLLAFTAGWQLRRQWRSLRKHVL